MAMIKTRSGLTPDMNKLFIDISTEHVERYLQKKFDAVSAKLRASGVDAPNIDVHVDSGEASRKFVPLAITLSLDVIEDKRAKEKGKNNRDELPMFNPTRNTGNYANISAPYWKILEAYQYDKKDRTLFQSSAWCRQKEVSRESSRNLVMLSVPRIHQVDKDTKVVLMLLDPVRIFYDMLVDTEHTGRKFMVEIKKLKKQETGEFIYTVFRYTDKSKKSKKNFNLAEELNRKIRGH
jgi:hypothetical protein